MEPSASSPVVLLSCGYDSTAAWMLMGRPRALFFRTDTMENTMEVLMYDRLRAGHRWLRQPVNLTGVVSRYSSEDATLPARNLVFVSAALAMGYRHIILAAATDWAYDKRLLFTLACEMVGRVALGGGPVKVRRPYRSWTKAKLIEVASRHCGSHEWLRNCYSCYKGDRNPCGSCHACKRAMIAFSAAKVPVRYWPWQIPSFPDRQHFHAWALDYKRPHLRGLGELRYLFARVDELGDAFDAWPAG